MIRTTLTCLALAAALSGNAAYATTYYLGYATDLFVPSFRGDASTTWLGWDLFDDVDTDPLDSFMLIGDTTPDLGNVGTDGGSFITTNGEDHLSGSGNYYSGSGTPSEDVTFDTAGVNGSGFTTVIVQAKALFGGFGTEILFGEIDGVAPTLVAQTTNAIGSGQVFAKYEIPGTADPQTFELSGVFIPDFGTHISFDQFVIDTVWSADGFAADTATTAPEPTAAVLAALAMAGFAARRR